MTPRDPDEKPRKTTRKRRGGWMPPGESEQPAAPTKKSPAPPPPKSVPPAKRAAPKAQPEPSSAAETRPAFRPPAPMRKPQPARPDTARVGFRVPGRLGRRSGVISRGERALFWGMLAAVVAMSIFLLRYRERVREHFAARAAGVPMALGAEDSVAAPLTLVLANDDSGALVEHSLTSPLPADPNTRARVILERLLAAYAQPGSSHPLQPFTPGAPPVDQVFLLPVPGAPPHSTSQLAVVNLSGSFVHTHPSGIEPETLTLLSMIATLHANLPSVTQVHFLVDGEPRPTLAGHADLSDTYLAATSAPTPGADRQVAQ